MTEQAIAQDEGQEVRDYLRVLWRRKWVLLACVLVIPGATYAISRGQPREYSASAQLQVQAGSVDTSLFIAASPANNVPGEALAAAARLVNTAAVANQAARILKLSPPALQARVSGISTSVDLSSGFLTISAVSRAPQQSAQIANAYAKSLVRNRVAEALSQIDSAIAQLEGDLAAIRPSDGIQRSQISDQLQRVRALRAAQGHNAQIVAPATPPASPSSPRPVHDSILALLAAVLIGIALAFLLDRIDRRVRDVDEIEALMGAPLLGFVPADAFGGRWDDPWMTDAFTMLRTTVAFFNVDREISSIVVTSSVAQEGKTTVATNLAVAYVRAGLRVILVDADLRRPRIAERLGLEAELGLESVLIGDAELSDAILCDVETEAGPLWVLPVVTLAPNPSELLASQRMRSTVTKLTELADIVIFDTAPVLEVGDTLPLLGQASAVLPVVRTGASRRDAIRRMSGVLRKVNAHTVGVVVTGATESGLIGTGPYQRYRRYSKNSRRPPRMRSSPPASNGALASSSRLEREEFSREDT